MSRRYPEEARDIPLYVDSLNKAPGQVNSNGGSQNSKAVVLGGDSLYVEPSRIAQKAWLGIKLFSSAVPRLTVRILRGGEELGKVALHR